MLTLAPEIQLAAGPAPGGMEIRSDSSGLLYSYPHHNGNQNDAMGQLQMVRQRLTMVRANSSAFAVICAAGTADLLGAQPLTRLHLQLSREQLLKPSHRPGRAQFMLRA